MEAAAAADAQSGGHHEQGRGLHLAGLDPQTFPGLPLIEQLIAHRHTLGAVLAVEAVLALDHAGVAGLAHGPGGLRQSAGDAEIRHGGELDGGVLQAGVLKPDGPGGHHDVSGLDVQIDAAAGAHPDKGVRADGGQLLHGDGGGGPADAGGAHRHLLPQERPGINPVLPVLAHEPGVVEQRRDGLAAARVAGQDAVAAHVAGDAIDVVLSFQFLHNGCLPKRRFSAA